MKLISDARIQKAEFQRLMHQYRHFRWAIAWASPVPTLFQELVKYKEKIHSLIVGIHFYQTHPDFIQEFLDDPRVRFIQQPEGTFHPKLYLFSNSDQEWELLLGSTNFTKEAFSRNIEASLLICNEDDVSNKIHSDTLDLISSTYNEGVSFDAKMLNDYKVIWQTHQRKIESLSGRYGNSGNKSIAIHNVPVITKSWNDFISEIKKEPNDGFEKRLSVIRIAQQLFKTRFHFREMTADERKFIAGLRNKLNIEGAGNWDYFGNMSASGYFSGKISQNDELISRALDEIPPSGQVTKAHYENFKKLFCESLAGEKLASATRLLSMKRPDMFICLNSKNQSALCDDFGIKKFGMSYERYWNDIIERILDSNWWQNPDPKTEEEQTVSNARMAFLDSLYYVP
ncbi:phospholipase D family protein [Siphonobacter aquaeclarae]|uniref:PLD-like domain-containing protein n=1 Tax=Siphonobacter aquaeclarae TaxID=563176 RepID=A0A1G9YHX1_9BACT|nr:phospholipase D family protein [Siphonobacter aquaeclarae]SDN08788.1 PLD-like domain-containing protein [Siphonobacter aquaeclarae]